MFSNHAQGLGWDAIGEHNQVLARPSRARNDKSVEFEEVSRFPNLLHTRVFLLFTLVFQRTEFGCIQAKGFEALGID